MTCRALTLSMAVTLVAPLILSSCFVEDEIAGEEGDFYQREEMLLGEQLENPFSVENMYLAYENLKSNNPERQFSIPEIHTTHLYIRFLPRDQAQLDILRNDTTLNLIDHPIDYKIIREGDYYHDPSVQDSDPSYLYASVPLNYVAPAGISFEILDNLYLPHHDAAVLAENGRINSDLENDLDQLEDEALRMTGNSEEIASKVSSDATVAREPARWTPAGRVTVWDNRLNKHIPLAGVKVEARRWFDVKQAITNEEGYFRMDGTFRRDAKYRLVFERSKFDIRSGTFGQAQLNGPKKRGDWFVNIERNGITFHYAHVFRAAMRYYYGNIGGLRRPSFRLKYSVFDKKGNHSARNIGNWSAFGINPNIFVYRFSPRDGSENDADEMFSNTCHETAHTTHMQIMNGGPIQFLQVSETIRESWAIGVEWFITQMEYKERGILNYAEPDYRAAASFPTLYGFQYWNKKRNETLTSLFIDVVDRNNQKGQSFGSFRTGTVSDPVSGFTFAEIESTFLKKVYGVGSLGEELKANKPAELTNQQIDLFIQNF